MKDYIAWKTPIADLRMGYEPTKALIQKAWEHVATPETFRELLAGMRDRCQAVIDAKGMYIDY